MSFWPVKPIITPLHDKESQYFVLVPNNMF